MSGWHESEEDADFFGHSSMPYASSLASVPESSFGTFPLPLDSVTIEMLPDVPSCSSPAAAAVRSSSSSVHAEAEDQEMPDKVNINRAEIASFRSVFESPREERLSREKREVWERYLRLYSDKRKFVMQAVLMADEEFLKRVPGAEQLVGARFEWAGPPLREIARNLAVHYSQNSVKDTNDKWLAVKYWKPFFHYLLDGQDSLGKLVQQRLGSRPAELLRAVRLLYVVQCKYTTTSVTRHKVQTQTNEVFMPASLDVRRKKKKTVFRELLVRWLREQVSDKGLEKQPLDNKSQIVNVLRRLVNFLCGGTTAGVTLTPPAPHVTHPTVSPWRSGDGTSPHSSHSPAPQQHFHAQALQVSQAQAQAQVQVQVFARLRMLEAELHSAKSLLAQKDEQIRQQQGVIQQKDAELRAKDEQMKMLCAQLYELHMGALRREQQAQEQQQQQQRDVVAQAQAQAQAQLQASVPSIFAATGYELPPLVTGGGGFGGGGGVHSSVPERDAEEDFLAGIDQRYMY